MLVSGSQPTPIHLDRWRNLAKRGVHVDFPFFLAPMVGLSHVALRTTIRSYMPEGAKNLLFTEMLSSRRLPTERIGDRPETATDPEETNLVPQLLGNEERFIRESLKKLEAKTRSKEHSTTTQKKLERKRSKKKQKTFQLGLRCGNYFYYSFGRTYIYF